MSDVERICAMNHERVKWAEEYQCPSVSMKASVKTDKAKAKRRQECKMTALLACAAACGAGTAFLSIGIASGSLAAVLMGGITVLVFMVSGFLLDLTA